MQIRVSSAALAISLLFATPSMAQTAPSRQQTRSAPEDGTGVGELITVTAARETRSVSQLSGNEIQKMLPGMNPLKAIETLPGVTFMTADPWGNNEQNNTLYVHGFNAQQLGYTLDGVPLGDQSYGNFNGLSPQRAIVSENVGLVTLASGAGDLGTASTSNLGGTIDMFSSDPTAERGARISQTFGSYDAFRTYARVDSGTFGNGNSFYVSGVRQDAKATFSTTPAAMPGSSRQSWWSEVSRFLALLGETSAGSEVHPIAEAATAADDLDTLRHDPGFKLALDKLPGEAFGLASQPTMSRWENAPTTRELVRLTGTLVDLYCASYPVPPAAVTLDIDDTSRPR